MFIFLAFEESIHVKARKVDVLWLDFADIYYLFGFYYRGL
jgi:hypothetical protein